MKAASMYLQPCSRPCTTNEQMAFAFRMLGFSGEAEKLFLRQCQPVLRIWIWFGMLMSLQQSV